MTRLVWREGRATPDVGGRKGAGGKVTASREATAQEEKQIKKGRWVTTRPPGQANKKSSVRPQMAAKQKNPKTDDGRKAKAGGYKNDKVAAAAKRKRATSRRKS